MNIKDHLTKIIVSVVTAVILGVGAFIWTFAVDRYNQNAWANDIQQLRTDWKENRIKELRRELNEIEQKELDGKASKYDLLRKKQLERDYGELLKK